jgi:hypothetical protein
VEQEEKTAEQGPTLADKMVDLRNDAIVQAANAFMFARSAALVAIGAAALGVDRISAFAQASVTRGEAVEADAQQRVERYQHNVKAQMQAAEASRDAMMQQLHATLNENLQVISRVIMPQPKQKPAADTPAAEQEQTQA